MSFRRSHSVLDRSGSRKGRSPVLLHSVWWKTLSCTSLTLFTFGGCFAGLRLGSTVTGTSCLRPTLSDVAPSAASKAVSTSIRAWLRHWRRAANCGKPMYMRFADRFLVIVSVSRGNRLISEENKKLKC